MEVLWKRKKKKEDKIDFLTLMGAIRKNGVQEEILVYWTYYGYSWAYSSYNPLWRIGWGDLQ